MTIQIAFKDIGSSSDFLINIQYLLNLQFRIRKGGHRIMSRTLVKVISILFTFTLLFQIGAIAFEIELDQNQSQLQDGLSDGDQFTDPDENSLEKAAYKNIFKFAITKPGHNSAFSFNYTLDENNKGRFGIEGKYSNYGYKWTDTYDVGVYDMDSGEHKLSVTLHKGQDVFFTAPRFINDLNRVSSEPGSRIIFKASNSRNIIVNGETLTTTPKEFTVGYTSLYAHRYRSLVDFKVDNKSFPEPPPIEFRFPMAVGIDIHGKVEFYTPKVYSDDYTFSDDYIITKIDLFGKKISETKLDKGTNVRTGLETLAKNMQINPDASPVEMMLQSRENNDSIRVEKESIKSRADYYTFNYDRLQKRAFLDKISLRMKFSNGKGEDINDPEAFGDYFFNFFATQGSRGHPRFGVYGRFMDLGLDWGDNYEFIVSSDYGAKASVNLYIGQPVIPQVFKLPDGLNDHSIFVGDILSIRTSKPNSVIINGELVKTTYSKYKVTNHGLVPIEPTQNPD